MKARAAFKALASRQKPEADPPPVFEEEELKQVHSKIQTWKRRATTSIASKKIEEQIADEVEKAKKIMKDICDKKI